MESLYLLGREHRSRYSQLLSIISKYGFDEILSNRRFQRIPLLDRLRLKKDHLTSLSRGERIRLALEEMGGAFVKIGQLLSNRPDLLPDDIIKELEKLQDSIPAFPTEKAVEIIESELGSKLEDVFLMFDPVPLATGSIAQVHRAILSDLTSVIVKIQRPNIEKQIKIDFDILIYAFNHVSNFTKLKKQYKEKNPLKELREELEKEADLKNEESNILRFKNNFKNDKKVYVPSVYPIFGTEKVLVMDYVKGIKISDKDKIINAGFSPVKVADDLLDAGFRQIFEHNFFHGDAHPGNILLLNDGKICFIDFGLMGYMTSKQQKIFNELVIAFSQQNSQKIARVVQQVISKENSIDVDQLEYDISSLMTLYYDKNLKEIKVVDLLSDILKFLDKYSLSLPANIYLLIKTVTSFEGIGRGLNPELELADNAKRLASTLIRKNLSPVNFAKEVYLSSSDVINLIKEFPGELRSLLQLLQQGKFTVNANLSDLRSHVDYIFKKLEMISNRIIYALLLSSVILGTSLLLRNVDSSKMYGIPIFAGLGFIISLILAFLLLISILRSKTI